jgi:hypothetical protein
VIPVYSFTRVLFYQYKVHTRLRVQRAPGVPHALCFIGRKIHAQLGRIAPRGRERAFRRHCEWSEAIHLSLRGLMDCFAPLAMTAQHLDCLGCLKLERRHCEFGTGHGADPAG